MHVTPLTRVRLYGPVTGILSACIFIRNISIMHYNIISIRNIHKDNIETTNIIVIKIAVFIIVIIVNFWILLYTTHNMQTLVFGIENKKYTYFLFQILMSACCV